MQRIDEIRLKNDVVYRVDYLGEFMGFDGGDIAAIQAAPWLASIVPTLGNTSHGNYFTCNATQRHFVPRKSGCESTGGGPGGGVASE